MTDTAKKDDGGDDGGAAFPSKPPLYESGVYPADWPSGLYRGLLKICFPLRQISRELDECLEQRQANFILCGEISGERDDYRKRFEEGDAALRMAIGVTLERNEAQAEVARLREALMAMMARFKDDEEAWDAGPCECWVKARAALSTGGE